MTSYSGCGEDSLSIDLIDSIGLKSIEINYNMSETSIIRLQVKLMDQISKSSLMSADVKSFLCSILFYFNLRLRTGADVNLQMSCK